MTKHFISKAYSLYPNLVFSIQDLSQVIDEPFGRPFEFRVNVNPKVFDELFQWLWTNLPFEMDINKVFSLYQTRTCELLDRETTSHLDFEDIWIEHQCWND